LAYRFHESRGVRGLSLDCFALFAMTSFQGMLR
jgi:hypothetical protein